MLEPRKKSKKIRSPKRPDASRLRVVLVGPGRLGTVLGRGLVKAGYRLETVISRTGAAARKAARQIKPNAHSFGLEDLDRLSAKEKTRLQAGDLIIITTPDEAIGQVAAQLSQVFATAAPQDRTVLHSSGALSSEVLQPLARIGISTGSLHPLVAVSDSQSDPGIFRKIYFCVEGDRRAVKLARSIARALGAQSFTIDAKTKALYHASAVTASGHITALFDIALEMLGRCGLSPRRAREILRPLFASNAANLAAKEPARALTGTFARGDISTARKHLAAIKSANLPEAMTAYLLLARRSISLAEKINPKSRELDEIAKFLSTLKEKPTR